MQVSYSHNEQPGSTQDLVWCALYTRHQHEKGVAGALAAKGFEVLLPLYNSVRHWKDRNKVIALPLFPCYVLVRGAVTRRLQVLTTPGVHMIVTSGERVATIPEDQIQALRRALEGPYRIEPHPFLKCGEWVRVKRGALEGTEGILVRKKNLCRLILSVEIVSRSVAVEIDAADVEAVTSPERMIHGQPAHLGMTAMRSQLYSMATDRVGWGRK